MEVLKQPISPMVETLRCFKPSFFEEYCGIPYTRGLRYKLAGTVPFTLEDRIKIRDGLKKFEKYFKKTLK